MILIIKKRNIICAYYMGEECTYFIKAILKLETTTFNDKFIL